jgi:hypothetical protein
VTRSKVTVPDNRDFAFEMTMDTQRYSDAPLVLRRSFSRTKVKDERRIYPKVNVVSTAGASVCSREASVAVLLSRFAVAGAT